MTSPYLSKYERARIIGVRALQIRYIPRARSRDTRVIVLKGLIRSLHSIYFSQNAPIFVEIGNVKDPIEIARKELDERKIPFCIRRNLPNEHYEIWRLDDLIF